MAASCAAILAVYAAGYWRTRDEVQRFETQAQARRPARPAPGIPAQAPARFEAPAPVPVVIQAGTVSAPAASTLPAPAPAPVAPTAPPPPGVPVAGPVPAAANTASAVAPVVDTAPPVPGVTEPVPTPTVAPTVVWRDGVYTGWGLSRHGDIEARIVIRNGRIRSSEIATCATRYPCYVIESIYNQPVERQSADVDWVSRASESADAYGDAVWQALQKAEEAAGTPSSTQEGSP